jgi:hypothetical protein
MAQLKRTAANITQNVDIGAGPYLAKVVSHLDPTFMGGLEVTLLREQGNILGDENQTYVVRCASPFFGSTPYEYMGSNKADFNDTQKSYGMWFVPPDIGVTVMVVFIDGDPSSGYWIACVPPRFSNNMVPGIAASTAVELSDADKKKYDTTLPLPVGEINRLINGKEERSYDAEKIKKPVHPLADHLVEQGLLEDDVRGFTTASARREAPSAVYGISTPGPLDKRNGAKRAKLGAIQDRSPGTVPVSRLGGTQIVMDDGDDRFQRKKPAGEIGQGDAYADTLNGERGDPEIPASEFFRVRTRTGHQLLFHNSEDLIYIGNARGTSWIELTSNGKIDIFAEDSISIHTKNDLNIRANRDINLEAGRNVNIKATAEYQDPTKLYEPKNIFDATGNESGRVQIESVQNMNLLIGRNGKIHLRNNEQIQGNFDIKVMGNMRIAVQDKDEEPTHTNIEEEKIIAEQPEEIKGLHIYSYENVRMTTEKNVEVITKENVKVRTDIDVDVWSVGNVKVKTKGNLDVNTDGNNAFTSGGTTDINSGGGLTQTAPRIDLNGPTARIADEAVEAVDDEFIADVADKVLPLHLHPNFVTDIANSEWVKKRYVADVGVASIMKRIPQHEPWPLHENLAPDFLGPGSTDREIKEE